MDKGEKRGCPGLTRGEAEENVATVIGTISNNGGLAFLHVVNF